jgi:hypothetical protein
MLMNNGCLIRAGADEAVMVHAPESGKIVSDKLDNIVCIKNY